MKQPLDTNANVDELIEPNAEASLSNVELSIQSSLETHSSQSAGPTSNHPPNENTETAGGGDGDTPTQSSMSPSGYTSNTDQPSTRAASQANPIALKYNQSIPPSHDEVGGTRWDASEKEESSQKAPLNSSNIHESTPKKISSSYRPPLTTPQRKEEADGNTSTAAAIASSSTAVNGNSNGIPPTPVRSTKGNPVTAATNNGNSNTATAVSTPGPPPLHHHPTHSSYGWMPGGSPPHPYHPHPYPPMHHYLHPPMYGSPDSAWNTRTDSNGSNTNTGTGSTSTNAATNGDTTSGTLGTSGKPVQSPPPPIPTYGWHPQHMSSYPYPPPPHPYPNVPNNRYPPMHPPPPHHYPWPPPMTLPPPPPAPLLHPQQRHPMNTNRSGSGKGNSTGAAADRNGNIKSNTSASQSLNHKNTAATAMKSKSTHGSVDSSNGNGTGMYLPDSLGYGYNHMSTNGMQSDGNDNRALSPTEIELMHRDEIQHMGCTCKKTRCLKLYCQCFGAKLYCGTNCRCMMCFNNRKHEKQRKEAMRNILSRNLSAFDTKFKKDAAIVLVEKPIPVNPAISSTTLATNEDTATIPPTTSEYANGTIHHSQGLEGKNSDVRGTTTTTPEGMNPTTTSAATLITSSEVARVLAHRLGCKCRKSACMKKYCECYAANVKCSASCRCMGCKNVGGNSNGGSRDYHESNMPMHHGMDLMSVAAHTAAHQAARQQYHHLPPYSMTMNNHPTLHNAPAMRQYGMVDNSRNSKGLPQQQPQSTQQATSVQNNWNDPLSAAESLTFLKHGSPAKSNIEHAAARQPNRQYSMGVSPITKSPGIGGIVENESIPSLTSSSEGDSPHNGKLSNHLQVMSTPESYRGEDSALLIAAMAMTEFGQSPPPTSSMLSPDTIRTFNTENGDDVDGGESMSATPSNIDDGSTTRSTSKRSINFDNLPDNETRNKRKRTKTHRWK